MGAGRSRSRSRTHSPIFLDVILIAVGADPGNDGVGESGDLGRVKPVPKVIQPYPHGVTGRVITHVEGRLRSARNGNRRIIRSAVINTVRSKTFGPGGKD